MPPRQASSDTERLLDHIRTAPGFVELERRAAYLTEPLTAHSNALLKKLHKQQVSRTELQRLLQTYSETTSHALNLMVQRCNESEHVDKSEPSEAQDTKDSQLLGEIQLMPRTPGILQHICRNQASCVASWVDGAAAADRAAAQEELARCVTDTGLLPALAAAATKLAAAVQLWKQQQRNKQQGLLPMRYAQLAMVLLCCWRRIVTRWPTGEVLTDQHLAPTLQPVATLAAAVLGGWPPGGGSSYSAGSSRNRGSSSSGRGRASASSSTWASSSAGIEQIHRVLAVSQAVYIGSALAGPIASEVSEHKQASLDQPSNLLEAVATAELQLLLLANLALTAQVLHKRHQGWSPWATQESSSSNSSGAAGPLKLPVPAFHLQLFEALGLTGYDEEPDEVVVQYTQAPVQAAYHVTSERIQQLQVRMQKLCEAVRGGQQQQQGGEQQGGEQELLLLTLTPVVPMQLVVPLLLVMIELPLLDQDDITLSACMQIINETLQSVTDLHTAQLVVAEQQLERGQQDSSQQQQQQNGASSSGNTSSEQCNPVSACYEFNTLVMERLAHPVLQLLVPAVVQRMRQQVEEEGQAQVALKHEMMMVSCAMVVYNLALAAANCSPGSLVYLAGAFYTRPQLISAALEASMRYLPRPGTVSAEGLGRVCHFVQRAFLPVLQKDDNLAAAAAAVDQAAAGSETQAVRLFSFLISWMKAADAVREGYQASPLMVAGLASDIARSAGYLADGVLQAAAAAAGGGGPASSNVGSSSSSSSSNARGSSKGIMNGSSSSRNGSSICRAAADTSIWLVLLARAATFMGNSMHAALSLAVHKAEQATSAASAGGMPFHSSKAAAPKAAEDIAAAVVSAMLSPGGDPQAFCIPASKLLLHLFGCQMLVSFLAKWLKDATLAGEAAAAAKQHKRLLKQCHALNAGLVHAIVLCKWQEAGVHFDSAAAADSAAAGASAAAEASDTADAEVAEYIKAFVAAAVAAGSWAGQLEELAGDLAQELVALGSAVCAQLPQELCCNSPACSNTQMISEVDLVKQKSTRCSGCRRARYCSRQCQAEHWQEHRPVCKRMQQQQLKQKNSLK